ncbi:FRG domain-containing protein [Microvirga calopogonii]|uniref:FRG domain-containing protein n=1 Tax=Microvirga calopogonii TaxID=2078013 RepID=UPI0013B451EC|nr:FRG domain-containing protein [Microvirga calopogonii]
MSRWRTIYRNLREVELLWPTSYNGPERQIFRAAIVTRWKSLKSIMTDAERINVSPPHGFWDAVNEIRSELESELEFEQMGIHPHVPYEDVYQAAVALTVAAQQSPYWRSDPNLTHIFRGSNNHEHALIPWIFRLSDEESKQAEKRLGVVVAALRATRPELSEEQAVALVQHYKDEFGVGTWLIDVTWDLRVALFFASFGGSAGKLGSVVSLSCREWERLSANGRNRLGSVCLVEAPGIQRIAAQRALFLHTSHPELFEQYVAHSRYFKQHDGLIFEDLVDPEAPVSREALLPTKDATLDLILSVRENPLSLGEAGPLDTAPIKRADDDIGADDYMEIVLSWAEAKEWRFDQATKDVLRVLRLS